MNKLYNGDCLELLKDVPDKSIDMILTDLPYGTTACKWDSEIDLDRLWVVTVPFKIVESFIATTTTKYLISQK